MRLFECFSNTVAFKKGEHMRVCIKCISKVSAVVKFMAAWVLVFQTCVSSYCASRAALRCFARSCQQVVQSRVLFENVLGMKMLLLLVGLSGSEASNTCSNMHTIPFSPDMAGPQGKFCPFFLLVKWLQFMFFGIENKNGTVLNWPLKRTEQERTL